MKNNKGFTLIELLAVIVVLAIVMVLAATTVLPLVGNARENAFGVEATGVVKAAKDAVDLYILGEYSLGGTATTSCLSASKKICITVSELIASGRFDADSSVYSGTVTVDFSNTSAYGYTLNFKKGAEFAIIAGTKETYTKNVSTSLATVSTWVANTHEKCTCAS